MLAAGIGSLRCLVRNVLIVDDDDFFGRMVIRALVKLGCDYTYCADGKECLEVVRSGMFNYDLILMDIHMPNLIGSEATSIIRTLSSNPLQHVPIVALTGDESWQDPQRLKRAGFTGFLNKPRNMQDLHIDISAEIAALYDPPLRMVASRR